MNNHLQNSNLGNKRQLNFDLNLIPMIDVFSACICFLLMTVVWLQIGILQVSQAVGTTNSKANPPSIVVSMDQNGSVKLAARDLRQTTNTTKIKFSGITVGGQDQRPNHKQLESIIKDIAKNAPEIKTVLVLPSAKTNYQDILNVMDQFRNNGMRNIGITPL